VAEDAPGDIGISAAYDEQAKRVRVFRVAPDSPAEKAGIKEDDFLLSVGGVDTGTKRFDDLRKMLEGPTDSKVVIVTSHGGILNRQEIVRKQLVNE
jgi:C-terminal processing protease CtpA/Prc